MKMESQDEANHHGESRWQGVVESHLCRERKRQEKQRRVGWLAKFAATCVTSHLSQGIGTCGRTKLVEDTLQSIAAYRSVRVGHANTKTSIQVTSCTVNLQSFTEFWRLSCFCTKLGTKVLVFTYQLPPTISREIDFSWNIRLSSRYRGVLTTGVFLLCRYVGSALLCRERVGGRIVRGGRLHGGARRKCVSSEWCEEEVCI